MSESEEPKHWTEKTFGEATSAEVLRALFAAIFIFIEITLQMLIGRLWEFLTRKHGPDQETR